MFDRTQQMELFRTAVDLKRIDPSLNIGRFYPMAVQPDVFGASFVREWGRIGLREQTLVELHCDEGRAVNPLVKLTVVTRMRGCNGEG